MTLKWKPSWKGFKPRTSFDRVRQRRRVKLTTYPKRGTRRWLKALLDQLIRVYLKLRDECCVTCFSTENLEVSHYFKRGYLETRWNLKNCNRQCHECNARHNYDPFRYRMYMVEAYGEDVIAELNELRLKRRHIPDSELQDKVVELRGMIATMRKAA